MEGVEGSFEHPPITIHSSPTKLALTIIGCMGFVLLGVLLVRSGSAGEGGVDRVVAGWLSIIVFGAFNVLAVPKSLRPDRLTLSPAGLRFDTFLGTAVNAAWSDLSSFEIWSYRGARLVMFDVSRTRGSLVRFQGVNRLMSGYDVALPGGWPMSAEALAGILSDAKARWGASEPRPALPPA